MSECEHPHEERTPSGVVSWTATERDTAVIVRQNERMKTFSGEAEGRPKGAVKLWRKDRDTQMIRQNIQESSQMLRTARSIRSVGKGRMILLFNSKFFEEIAILSRNSSILSDESTTIRFHVPVQSKSEKRKGRVKNSLVWD